MLRTLLILSMSAAPVFAADVEVNGLTITDIRTFETPKVARAAAGYLTITNSGDAADSLVGVESALPRTEIHRSFSDNGVMRMEPVDVVTIAPGETVVLKPGGLHVMFMGLDGDPFEIGEKISATLLFEAAGAVEVAFDVIAR